MIKVALVCATRLEIPSSLRRLELNTWISHGQLQIRLVVTGIGQTKARASITELCLKEKPDVILSVGICGGISPVAAVGQLLLVSRVYHRGLSVGLIDSLQDTRECLQTCGLDYLVGALETFDCPVTAVSMVNAPATVGVDMESFAVAEIAEYYNVRLIILKVVSDIIPRQRPLLWSEAQTVVRILVNIWVRRVMEPLNLIVASFLER